MSRHRLNASLLAVLYAGLAVVTAWRTAALVEAGGGRYVHGDWLISNAAGPLRRGAGGSTLIWLSDVTGWDLLTLLATFQVAVVVALAALVLLHAMRQGIGDRLLFLLISPAFLLFWLVDFGGALRKESVVVLSVALFLLTGPSAGRNAAVAAASLALFAVSAALHEVNALMLPFWIAAAWIALVATAGQERLWAGLSAAAAIVAVAAVAYALVFPTVPDTGALCRPLLARGFDAEFCTGAIAWMDKDSSYALSRVKQMIRFDSQWSFLMAYGLALTPVVLALDGLSRRWIWVALAVGSAAVMLPIYAVAIDWGRWVFMHATMLTLILMLAGRQGWLPQLQGRLPGPAYAVMMVVSFSWGMSHVAGILEPGMAVRAEMAAKAYIAGDS